MKFLIKYGLCIALLSSCAFSQKKSTALLEEAKAQDPNDAIIVPGVPHDGKSWSSTMEGRVLWAKYLYDQGLTKNIIYSGGAVYSEYSEAKIMAEYGKAMGIPAQHIFTDTLAEHSSENVYYSYRIAKENGFKKVALATDPFQAKQVYPMIKKLKLPIGLLPIVFDTLKTIDGKPEPIINPSIAKEDSFVSIKERESLFVRIQGTLGKQIIFYEEDIKNERLLEKYRKDGRVISSSDQMN